MSCCARPPSSMLPQVGLHKSGRAEDIVQETRLFDETKLETFSMRTKEGAHVLMQSTSRRVISCAQPGNN